MAARGFFVCRAAGGAATVLGAPVRLRYGRGVPDRRSSWVGPWSAARAACEAGRLDPVQKVLTEALLGTLLGSCPAPVMLDVVASDDGLAWNLYREQSQVGCLGPRVVTRHEGTRSKGSL